MVVMFHGHSQDLDAFVIGAAMNAVPRISGATRAGLTLLITLTRSVVQLGFLLAARWRG
jgi:hypothetical protein